MPLLVYLVGERVSVAIGTSLVIVGGAALQGFVGRFRMARIPLGISLGVIGIVGALPGTYLAHRVSGKTQLLLFSIIMLVAAVAMFRSRAAEAAQGRPQNWTAVAIVGVVIGFLTGFLGVGGGFMIVPALVLALGVPMKSAIPTSLLVIALNCIWSLAGRLRGAEIDWMVAVIFLVGGFIGNAIGAYAAGRLGQRQLRRVFAVFIFAVGLFVAATATGLLPVNVK